MSSSMVRPQGGIPALNFHLNMVRSTHEEITLHNTFDTTVYFLLYFFVGRTFLSVFTNPFISM